MKDNYSKQHGVYDNPFKEYPETMTLTVVVDSDCKILEENSKELQSNDHSIGMVQCACGAHNKFVIFQKKYATVAQCSVCENEQVIYNA